MQFLTILVGNHDTCHQRQVHHVRIVQCSALGQRVRTVGSRRVTQDIEQQRLTISQKFCALANGEHIEHIALQGLSLKEGSVAHHGEGHRLQRFFHVGGLAGLYGEACPSEAVDHHRFIV